MRDIAVLGAGITGITTAYSLMRRGFAVTVYDRQRYAGMETSYANGGQLSASNAETWNQLSTVWKGIKWLFSPDAPLLVSPKPGWHKLSWMAEFLAAIPSHERNTTATARMAVLARAGLAEMAATAGVDFDFSPAGILHFYGSEAEMAHARRVTRLLADGGLERQELSRDEVFARAPQLRAEVAGGFWTESDSTGDIHRFTKGLADWLQTQGVTFRYGGEITGAKAGSDGVDITQGDETFRHDGVVVCAGVGSRALARGFGDRVNIYPVKGYSITVMLNDEASRAAAPSVSLLDDKAKIVSARLGPDRLRVAGTAEFNGEDRNIRMDRVRPLVSWVERHLPGVSTETCVPWAGLRPMMPDMMPRVGQGRSPRVFYNTGHGHLGWTLSPATAEGIARIIESSSRPMQAPVGELAPA